MSFATRLKKLTDYLYAPTNPASEDAIREDIDDSIQEVYDNVQTAMADTGGAGLVGYDGGYSTVKSALEAFESGGSGTIPPDDSITLAKQNSTVKTGLLADLDTTVKTDLVSAINEDVTNLEILRIAELDTGTADAYAVTTAGTFSRVDGNILPFIPANANTGASTINEDGNGVADIKKWVEGVSTALEEGDLPKFQKAELVWNSSEADFFFAPKGGATIKSIQSGDADLTAGTLSPTISAVNLDNSIVKVNFRASSSGDADDHMPTIKFLSNTQINLATATNGSPYSLCRWTAIEYTKLKSKQFGSKPMAGNNGVVTVDISVSEIDLNNYDLYLSFKTTEQVGTIIVSQIKYWMLDSTTIRTEIGFLTTARTATMEWQLIEL